LKIIDTFEEISGRPHILAYMYTNPVFNVESKVVALVKESLSTVSGCESDEALMKNKQNTRKSWTLLKKKIEGGDNESHSAHQGESRHCFTTSIGWDPDEI
jgi:hypothetical protein